LRFLLLQILIDDGGQAPPEGAGIQNRCRVRPSITIAASKSRLTPLDPLRSSGCAMHSIAGSPLVKVLQ
jgi:hypothetical protein